MSDAGADSAAPPAGAGRPGVTVPGVAPPAAPLTAEQFAAAGRVSPPGPAVDAAGEPLRLLAVHAHPDDESSKGAATMVRYRQEGARVLVATCTGGERGSVLNPTLTLGDVDAELPGLRIAEMAAAQRILDVEHAWLGFVDSGLPEGDPLPPLPSGCFALQDPAVAAQPLVALIRRFRPHVVLTYDENGGYPHPDHIMTHVVSLRAFDAAGDPGAYPGLGGPPWQPAKLYYHLGWHKPRLTALQAALEARGLDSPYTEWLSRWEDQPGADLRWTTAVACGEHFGARDDALRAHASQVDPGGRWFAVPLDLQRAVWPTEDYQLVRSAVPVQLPETDLFAGLRAAPAAAAEPVVLAPRAAQQVG